MDFDGFVWILVWWIHHLFWLIDFGVSKYWDFKFRIFFTTSLSLYYSRCRDKGLESYIGLWVLSEDVEWTEEEQIVIRGSNLKSHE